MTCSPRVGESGGSGYWRSTEPHRRIELVWRLTLIRSRGHGVSVIIAEPGGDTHLVNNGVLTAPGSEDVLTRHREASARIQNRSWTIGHGLPCRTGTGT